MIDLMEKLKNRKRWEPGSDIKKMLVDVLIYDKNRNEELQCYFLSKDKQGLTYDYIRNGIITAILQIPVLESNKISYLKKVDLLNKIQNVFYKKSKNRKHFDMAVDVNNLLE